MRVLKDRIEQHFSMSWHTAGFGVIINLNISATYSSDLLTVVGFMRMLGTREKTRKQKRSFYRRERREP